MASKLGDKRIIFAIIWGMKLQSINGLPDGFEKLRDESTEEGYQFLTKLRDQWIDGSNRFDRKGEIIYSVWSDNGELIGVGGLNIDPYLEDSKIGRVRHVYVAAAYQRSGVGRRIVQEIISYASLNFKLLRLRTDNPEAVKFYTSLGFSVVSGPSEDKLIYLEKKLK